MTLQEDGADGPLDTWTGRLGFRTVRLVTEPDAEGTSYSFVVNDRPVFVKGVNWIPDDAFPHRVDRARYADRLAQAAEAGVNLSGSGAAASSRPTTSTTSATSAG